MYNILKQAEDIDEIDVSLPEAIVSTLDDDLNTPNCIAEVSNLSKGLAKAVKKDDPDLAKKYKSELLLAGNALGILQQDPDVWLGYKQADENAGVDAEKIRKGRTSRNSRLLKGIVGHP